MTKKDVSKIMKENDIDAIMLGHTFRGFLDHRLELAYLTDYNFVDDTFMIYKQNGTPIIFSWPAEIEEMEKKVPNAIFIDTYKETFDVDFLIKTLKENEIKKFGALDYWSPLALDLYEKFKKEDIDIFSVPNIITQARATKDKNELDKLKLAQKGSEILIEDIIQEISEADIMNGYLAKEGEYLTVGQIKNNVLQKAYDLDLYWHFPDMFVLNSGEKTIESHNMGAKSDKIKANVPIIIDMVPRSTNLYCGNITRTVVKGKASKEVKQAYGGILRMTTDLIDGKMEEFSTYGDLSNFFKNRFKYYKSLGLDRTCAYGHGIGLWYHEAPWIESKFGDFKRGHAFTTEPGFSEYKKKFAVRIGNMWTINVNKPKVVTNHPKEKLIEKLEQLEI